MVKSRTGDWSRLDITAGSGWQTAHLIQDAFGLGVCFNGVALQQGLGATVQPSDPFSDGRGFCIVEPGQEMGWFLCEAGQYNCRDMMAGCRRGVRLAIIL